MTLRELGVPAVQLVERPAIESPPTANTRWRALGQKNEIAQFANINLQNNLYLLTPCSCYLAWAL